jgi:hypothetical protein
LIIFALKGFSKREFADRAYYEEIGFTPLFTLRSDLMAPFDSLAIDPAVC